MKFSHLHLSYFIVLIAFLAGFLWLGWSHWIESRHDASRLSFLRPETIPYPRTNPYSEAKYELGKKLFFDPRLSTSNRMACATCHIPSRSWTDGRARALGRDGQVLRRNAPTLVNAAWGWSYFWDGRARTLEEQALMPITAHDEMNLALEALQSRLESFPEYVLLFENAFSDGISPANTARAIATFERSLVSELAPFDEWVGGNESAISEEAKRGFRLFNTTAGCVKCHTGWRLTNGSFADIGLPSSDKGRGELVPDADLEFAFKTPTLRNVAMTAPYMHDGSLPTLEAVLENYDRGGTVRRKTTSLFLKPLDFTRGEKRALLAFLRSLTSRDEVVAPPSFPAPLAKEER